MTESTFELDVGEFCTALRERSDLPGERFRQPEFQLARCRAFSVLNEGVVGTMVESRSVRSFVLRYSLTDHLYLAFTKNAHDMRGGAGSWQRVFGGSVLISADTSSSIEVQRPEGNVTISAGLYVQRDYLVDCYGLNVDSLPLQCQDVFRGRRNSHFMLNLMLSSMSWMALDAIFRCTMAEPLRSIYLNAKYEELLVETVDMLNRCGRNGLGRISSKEARERQLIEEAAQIYRRDLKNAPSIAELSLKLGINRNKLTDGFKEIFGLSPADYAKGFRLDWAKERLAAGVMSIGEAAYATGYSNPSAFSRAYGEHFGKPPSGDNVLRITWEVGR